MAFLSSLNFLLILFTITFCTLVASQTFQVDFHHRFSKKVHNWAQLQGTPTTWHPKDAPEGSVEYYKELVRHDQALLNQRGRLLKNTDIYAFGMGNKTMSISSMGHLHYAFVSVGTPNQTFLVAISMSSGLFWLPCNCKQCAPPSSPLDGNVNFSIFSTNASSTSKEISCGSRECNLVSSSGETCTGIKNCPYTIKYRSANTSSSGFLVEDVLYLVKRETGTSTVQVPIVFGCGDVQTGFLLEAGAPNGVMGLGIHNVSVPTLLAKKGLISDSFSMCFGMDGSGRLKFGDKGSSDQSETPLVIDNNSLYYNISIEGMFIGNTTSETSFTAYINSGSTFTYLTDQIYKEFTTIFTKQIIDTPLSDSSLPFQYCYELSVHKGVHLPGVNFITQGESQFPVLDTTIYLSNKSQGIVGYCLAVLPGTDVNIIGQNFLAGLHVVFDRERMVLGWKVHFDDCSSTKSSTTLPTKKSTADPTSPPASPDMDAPAPLYPEITRLPRMSSWAPNLCPHSMLNTALILLFIISLMFSSILV